MKSSMNFEVIVTPHFLKVLKALSKKHKSLKKDFLHFAESLKESPFQGVELSPGIREVRLAITSKGKGKSGGARVITYTVVATECDGTVYLVELYDKADFSTVDVSVIKEMVASISEESLH